jgi:hypothetical protein
MLIGLTGLGRSGKDTVAGFIEDAGVERTHRLRFADDLKRICCEVYDWTVEHTDGDLKDVGDERYPRPCTRCTHPKNPHPGKIDKAIDIMGFSGPRWETCPLCKGEQVTYLTPREAMQRLGTEWARANYPNTWVDLTMRRAAEIPDEQIVLVTDVRYINEAKGILASGGYLIQVVRPGHSSGLSTTAQQHPSEVEQQSDEFQALVTHTLINDGTLDDLKEATISWLTKTWTS